MADGLLGSMLNPNTLARSAGLNTRYDMPARIQDSPARTVEGQVMLSGGREVAELPPQILRSGPRGEQALSQYQLFSGAADTAPGGGFAAVV